MEQENNQNKKRILIVEDDLSIRELYARVLSHAGFEVVEANDGEAGLVEMQKGGFDLILLDLMMPKVNGLAVLKRYKLMTPDKPNQKIVVLSNLDKDMVVFDSLAQGAAGYYVKDQFPPDHLVEEIKQYIS